MLVCLYTDLLYSSYTIQPSSAVCHSKKSGNFKWNLYLIHGGILFSFSCLCLEDISYQLMKGLKFPEDYEQMSEEGWRAQLLKLHYNNLNKDTRPRTWAYDNSPYHMLRQKLCWFTIFMCHWHLVSKKEFLDYLHWNIKLFGSFLSDFSTFNFFLIYISNLVLDRSKLKIVHTFSH